MPQRILLDLIYAAVILRAINEPRFGHLQVRYETNLLTHLLHSMPQQCRLSPNSGTRRKAVCRFIHDGSDEQDTWLLLNHLSVTIARKCITDIARIGENKNVSFEDQQQTLEKILASQSDGKYRLAPIKNPYRNSSPNSISKSTHMSSMQRLTRGNSRSRYTYLNRGLGLSLPGVRMFRIAP